MRILYAIQGTGNGHLTRSLCVIKELQKCADVDILVSGIHNEIKLPLHINYEYRGLGYIFGKRGGINLAQTFKQIKLRTFYTEIKNIPICKYNFLLNDFEPLSVRAAFRAGVPSIGLSNQTSLFHPEINKPSQFFSLSKSIMKYYANCDYNIGLHFESINQYIETPIIRNEIRYGNNSDKGYGIVYLPFYSDNFIYKVVNKIKNLDWVVFSKHSKHQYKMSNVIFEPLNSQLFTNMFLNCHLIITAAGFGTTTEALYLGKKMIVIPMKWQYEQLFNAYMLKSLNVNIINSLFNREVETIINNIINNETNVRINYPDNVKIIVEKIFKLYKNAIV